MVRGGNKGDSRVRENEEVYRARARDREKWRKRYLFSVVHQGCFSEASLLLSQPGFGLEARQ